MPDTIGPSCVKTSLSPEEVSDDKRWDILPKRICREAEAAEAVRSKVDGKDRAVSPSTVDPEGHLPLVGFTFVARLPGSNQGHGAGHCELIFTRKRLGRLLEQVVEGCSNLYVGCFIQTLLRLEPSLAQWSER